MSGGGGGPEIEHLFSFYSKKTQTNKKNRADSDKASKHTDNFLCLVVGNGYGTRSEEHDQAPVETNRQAHLTPEPPFCPQCHSSETAGITHCH